MNNLSPMRYERTDPCIGCGMCDDHKRCSEVRAKLVPYDGIRFTADGFDCALPVTIDSHSVCSYACRYCFSDNLVQSRDKRSKPIGQTSLRMLDGIFSGSSTSRDAEQFRRALKYDRRKNGYPTPVQLGGICDPCDNIERQQGWLLEFIKLVIKNQQPVRMSTKGNVLFLPEYQKAIAEAPYLFWVAFSIITPDDRLIELIDLNAPNATMRLRTMKALSKLGVKTSLRFRPMMPGVSDRTKRVKYAYKELIEKAANAGASAVSYEVMFVPGMMTIDTKARWSEMQEITGIDFGKLYRSFGKTQACMRPPFTWTENIMHAVKEEAHKQGMVVGVSDPVWKQLSDSGCCCGIMPDDPVFGNWQTESATNQLLRARDTGVELGVDDIIPAWAKDAYWRGICAPNGAGPLIVYKSHHYMWSDHLKRCWNDVKSQRGVMNYFQGALMPSRKDEAGNIFYKYVGLSRQNKPDYIWAVT